MTYRTLKYYQNSPPYEMWCSPDIDSCIAKVKSNIKVSIARFAIGQPLSTYVVQDIKTHKCIYFDHTGRPVSKDELRTIQLILGYTFFTDI